jgi:4-amino-4-deoxy-L-arabinose transferase-like glycosyltransferase
MDPRGILSRLSRFCVPHYAVMILCALLLAALGIRVVYLKNISLHVDEFVSLLAVRSLLEHGYPLLPSGTIYEQGLLFSYLEAPLLWVFGLNAYVGRAFSAVLSVATVALLYYVGSRLFSKPVGLVAATLQVFSAESIAWGARVRMYALLQFLVLLSVWFLWRGGTEEHSARYRWIAIVCYLGALFTHPVSILLYAPLLLGLLVLKGPSGILRPGFILEAIVPVAGMAATFLLKAIGQPGQLEALAGARPYLAPSLNFVRAFGQIDSFFLGGARTLLSVLFVSGLAVVSVALMAKARGRRSGSCGQPGLSAPLYLYAIVGCTVLEMVFLVGPGWRSGRYLFMVEPLFFVASAWVAVLAVGWVCRRLKHGRPAWLWKCVAGEPISRPMICLLVLAALLLLAPAAREVVTVQEWGYDLALEYVGEQWREGDTVLTIVPAACALYLPQCDYYAVGRAYEEYVFDKGGALIDRWVGASLLRSASQLEDVLKNNSRVWFVVDNWRLARRFDLDFIRSLVEQMDVVYEVRGVKVLLAQGYRTPPEPEVSESLSVSFGENVRLEGYELSNGVLPAGSELSVTLYWSTVRHLAEDYTVSLQLRGYDGSLISQDVDPPLENVYPTPYWRRRTVIPDPRVLLIPGGTEPGWYGLEVGLYRSDDEERLPVLGDRGSVVSDFLTLDYIQVTDDESVASFERMGTSLGQSLQLLGHYGVPSSIEPGQTIYLRLWWGASTEVDKDYTVFIHLVGPDNRIWAQEDRLLRSAGHPSSKWQVGDIAKQRYRLVLPPEAPPGDYTVKTGVYYWETGERLPVWNENGERVAGDAISLEAMTANE